MIRQVSVERLVAAPADRIFALLADPRRHAEFDGSGTVQGVVDGPERLSLGARFGMDMRIGAPYRMTNTVVEFEEGRRIAWQPRPALRGPARLIGGRTWRYELTPVSGGTLVRETWDISTEMLWAPLLVLRGSTRRNMARTLERLEEQVA